MSKKNPENERKGRYREFRYMDDESRYFMPMFSFYNFSSPIITYAHPVPSRAEAKKNKEKKRN